MELMEKLNILYQNNNIKFNSLLTNQKENIIYNKDCKYESVNIFVKLENTQSFSTCTDDIKDNEKKDSLYEKNINVNNIFSNSDFAYEDCSSNKIIFRLSSKEKNFKKREGNSNKFGNKIFKIDENKIDLNNKSNKINLNKKNSKKVNNLDFEFINRKKEIKNNDENIKIFKEDNENIKNNQTLKSFPPKIINLFHHKYNLSQNDENNNFINNDCYIKINMPKVPNVFYNHLMINNKKISKVNSNYFSISTTNRIKGKLLNILYVCPIKNM